MRYINDFKPGDRIAGIYLCKQKTEATTRNGKPYENVVLQDKTGSIDAKIWDPDSEGIGTFDALDYVDITGEVTTFNNALQLTIRRLRCAREGEYDPGDYLPVSSYDNDEMYESLLKLIASVGNRHLSGLLHRFFIGDQDFVKIFRKASAAKSVHHGFIGGLLEHTLSVGRFCDFLAKAYPFLNRDLLITAALLHDIGKTRELSAFPENDYTDEGQFLGHIIIGTLMVEEKLKELPEFPSLLRQELIHCILAHHGEYEFGSPKKPAIAEALALNMADNTDAKMEILKELQDRATQPGWQGYQRLLESNIFDTRVEE